MHTAEDYLRVAANRREAARQEYKEFQRVQNRRSGAKRRGEIAKETKLRLNRESAAAARHANRIYRATLEHFVMESEIQQSMLSLEAAAGRESRDALAEQVLQLQDQLVQLRGEQGDEDPEEYENVCSTKLLLERTAHIPELRMSPTAFAKSLMGPVACPAL